MSNEARPTSVGRVLNRDWTISAQPRRDAARLPLNGVWASVRGCSFGRSPVCVHTGLNVLMGHVAWNPPWWGSYLIPHVSSFIPGPSRSLRSGLLDAFLYIRFAVVDPPLEH